ncbi:MULTISPECIES: hypothetical protein [unclassified Nesterenkonia]|nr:MULTISPECIES: hypothetical protein [unclassified Nesterenkonia]
MAWNKADLEFAHVHEISPSMSLIRCRPHQPVVRLPLARHH